ncbi:MAG: histidine phosphatase family protein, partial [candidate division KSB1 bacterium]|nr:histidine phosphatase family protein [candidate division KSB1 bacterium]
MRPPFSGKHHFVSNSRVPIPELNNQILVDPTTGQVFMKGPVLKLKFPMLVVRHGQTEGNLRKVLQGQADGPENQLNEVGKEQAQQTAVNLFNEVNHRLGPTGLVKLAQSGKLCILTSPITRAKDTADFFIEYFKHQTGVILNSKVEPDLKEISFGKYDGFSLEEIPDQE